ncbi:MAG: hypothetical protein HY731_12830 [Candidatus Tectomicrobia bacterium]|nr:hypothetical protein [Candidatus Tectomicrobia bacterium]
MLSRTFQDQLSQDVLHFCLRQGILQHLLVALDLVEKYFSSIRELHLHYEHDPEIGEEWLVIEVTVQGEVEEVLDNYDTYTDCWVSSVPWADRHKIRLSYNIV